MADEDLASQEAEGGVLEEGAALENQDGQQADDTPEPIANLARDLGWTPREEWHGEPEKWKPAEQFIRDGRDIQQTTARELRAMREQVERMSGVTSQIIADKLAEKDAEWERKIAQASDDGDTATVLALSKQRPAPAPAQTGADPTVASWVSRNEWFSKEPLAASIARQVSDQLAKDGYDTAAQLEAAEKEVKRRFPELFPKPAKDPPGVQSGASRAPGQSNRVKGFAQMPPESQQMARDMVRRHPDMKLEDIAKSYWAQEGVSR